VRTVPDGATSSPGGDPSVAAGSKNTLYFGYVNADGHPKIAVSRDRGVHWSKSKDAGTPFGIQNTEFAEVIAGDDNRAAFAFLGTPADGDDQSADFLGVWHLYVAHTFNGGSTWTTSDVTPTLPMQRSGILRGGGANIVRNLLDFFDVTIDREGRVLVGYVNGCSGGNCAQATPTAHGNTYSATATIARQSSGRRLIAAFDPPRALRATSVPGMPFVTQRRVANAVHLAWNESDTGNSPISSYKIFRSTTKGAETLLATIGASQKRYTDSSATDPTKTYYYKVVAVNKVGESCANNEIASPFVGTSCDGIIIHQNDPSHPEATGGTAGLPPLPQLLIDYIAVGEPPSMRGFLMFKMKVGNLSTIPPNSRWRIAWNWWSPTNQMYYTGMTSDQNSAVTFEYGTLADAGVPAVLVLGETKIGVPEGNFSNDGTITMFVPKSAVGNPRPGDLLGAIGGKTITGDTPATNTFERSTTFVDHTFVKGQADNCYPPATYTVAGNVTCTQPSPSPTPR